MVRGIATNKKIRELIIKKYCLGKKIREIADELDLAKSTVGDILKHYRESGSVQIKGKSLGRTRIVSDRDRRLLVKICKLGRRSTLRAITAQWNAETGMTLSRECCRKWIKKSGLGFYKVITKIFIKCMIFYY